MNAKGKKNKEEELVGLARWRSREYCVEDRFLPDHSLPLSYLVFN